ncbi:MAG: MFS transporter [Pikeienuella sp.]
MQTAPPASSSPAMLLPVLSAANFTIGAGAFMVVAILSPMAGDLRMSEAEAGLVMVVYAVAYTISSPLLVSATGGLRRRDLLVAAMLVYALAAGVMAASPGPLAVLVGRAVAAAAAGVITPVAASVAAASVPPEARGRALTWAFFGMTLSQIFGVPLGAWIGYSYGWRVDFWAVAALSLAAALALARFVPRDIAVARTRLSDLGATLVDMKSMLGVSLTFVFLSSAYVLFTFTSPLLEAGMGAGRDVISLFLLISGIGAVAGNLASGRLADRLGPARTLALHCGAMALVTPVYSLLPIPLWALYLAGFLWSVFGWGFFAVQQSRLIALAPERSGVILSLNASAIYLGRSLGSGLGSALIARFGLDALGWAASALAIAALFNLLIVERVLARARP